MSTQSNQKSNLMAIIEKTSPSQIPAIPEIADRFKHLYSIIHPGAKSDVFYEAEKFHFMKLVKDSAILSECTKLSLYGCFLDVAVSGLSFDPSFKHLYLVPYNVNAGTKTQPKWEKRASLQISGYGELVLRQLQGQIKYAENPVLVYDGDEFSYGTRNDRFFVQHVSNLSKRTERIIACYIKLVRHDGNSDYKVITTDDMARFRKFSKDQNSKAWVDGEGGMWIAKCIKHAFKNYPKVRTGEFSALASNEVDEQAEVTSTVIAPAAQMNVPDNIDYGTGEVLPDDDSFVENPIQQAAPVTVQDDDF